MFPPVLFAGAIYLTWSPWHYSGQNFGISMMLARRAGARPTNDDRNLIWWSYLASYGVWFLALHNSNTAGQPNLIILPIPQGAARIGELICLTVYLVAGGYGHTRLVRQVGLRAMAGPLTLFATQFLWFLLPEVVRVTTDLEFPATYSSAGILAFMHCAQYLWITSYYASKERTASGPAGVAAKTAKEPGFRFLPYYFILVLGGIALFTPGPWLSSRLFGHDLVESFFIFAALINLHHFILDGAIWKLRDGRIARLLLGRNPPDADPGEFPAEAGPHSRLRWLLAPTATARVIRYSLTAGLLAIALVDQTQFWLTLKTSGQPAFALAQLINPQDTRVYFQRAKQLVAAGKSGEAMEELRRAIAINPRNAPAQHLLGELLFKSGDTKAALEHYDRMAVLFRPDYVTLVNSGLLASRRGETAKSLEHFEAALRLTPHDSTIHLYLGQALETSGDLPAAARQYALYISLHREDLAAPNVLPNYLRAGMKLAELSLRENHRNDAVSLYRRIAQVARENGRADEAALAETNLKSLTANP